MFRDWLIKLLKAHPRGTQAALARHLGIESSAMARMVSGERMIRSDELPEIAAFFGVPLPEIHVSDALRQTVDRMAREQPAAHLRGLPIVGEVAAGNWLDSDEMDEPRIPQIFVPPDPRFPAQAQRVWIVRGRSVEKTAADGTALVCVLVEWGIDPQEGDLVIAERKRHQGGLIERTAKRLRMKFGTLQLVPEYLDEKLNRPIPLKSEPDDDLEVRILAVVVGVYNSLRNT